MMKTNVHRCAYHICAFNRFYIIKQAEFKNSGEDPTLAEADLYYQDQFWGSLKPGDPVIAVNTFEGHVWNAKIKGEIVKTWLISRKDGSTQKFVFGEM